MNRVTLSPSGSVREDVFSAYAAAGSRVLSWVFVTAVVYRRLGPAPFAMLALVRTTIGLLNYTTLGLAPAMIRFLAVADQKKNLASEVYSSAAALAAITAILGAWLAYEYAIHFATIHAIPLSLANGDLTSLALLMGLGMVLRIAGDAAGAVLQVRGKIALDNLLLAAAEWTWIILVAADSASLNLLALWWAVAAAMLLAARFLLAHQSMGRGALSAANIRAEMVGGLLSFGLLVALAQAADFLYAPTDNILINRFISPLTVAVYAPAIQIDAGLLLLVAGLAAVLLPRSALAHAQGNLAQVRRYYLTGTTLSLALLAPAALAVWLTAPALLRFWLGNPMPATLAILPLVLIHTVVGGSAGVGRSVLLAVGKVRPFTLAVLIAGSCNVILSFIFVRYCGWGLRGIVLGTILAVVGRCALWTPWYVLKTLRAKG